MRCWNLTYNDPGRWAEVHAVSGKQLSFFAGLRSGGTGSPRGVLLSLPGDLNAMLTETSNAPYCNMQRTANGGILFFKVRLEVYGIPIAKAQVNAIRTEVQTSEVGVFTLLFNEGKQITFQSNFSNRTRWSAFLDKTFGPKKP